MWFFPPDPNSKWEFWLIVALANLVVHIRSPWALVGIAIVLYLIVCLMVVVLLLKASTRLWHCYRKHGFDGSRRAWVVQGAFIALVVVWLVVWAFETAAWVEYLAAWLLLACVVGGEGLEWYARRSAGAEEQHELPPDISLSDVVSWHETVTAERAMAGG